MRAIKLLLFFLAIGGNSLCAQTTSLLWQYNNINPRTILGPTGLALQGAGPAAADGDGFSVQLGYYTTATAVNPFLGTWIPIYGMSAPPSNTLFPSASMGDSKGTTNATTDDRFVESGTVTLANTLVMPANGQIMSIRYYNNVLSSATNYGAAGNPGWLWVTPTVTPNAGMSFNILDSGTLFLGGISVPQTNIAIVPEPSGILLFGSGLAIFWLKCLRRRRYVLG